MSGQPTLASPPCPIQFSTLFCMMAERTSDRTDLPAVLAFIFGAIVIVASIGSLLLTLFAVISLWIGATMTQLLSNVSSFEMYLFAIPAIMLGSILFLGGLILLLEPRNKNDAETLAAIRKALERPGDDFTNGKPPGGGVERRAD